MSYTGLIQFSNAGVVRSVPAQQFDVSLGESKTTEWTLAINDKGGIYNPEAVGTAWSGWLDNRAYDASDGYVKKLYASTTLADMPHQFPTGIPNAYGYGISPGDPKYRFRLSGRGIAAKLFKDDRDLPSVISKHSDLWTVQRVLADTFAAYGVSADVSGVSPDYVVARLQRNGGQPMSWIEGLLEVTQGAWREEGERIVCYQPQLSGGYHRVYDLSSTVIRQIGVDVSSTEVVNRVVVSRALDQGAVLATVEGTNFGRYNATFSKPVRTTTVNYTRRVETGGILSDFWFYDKPPPSLPVMVRDPRGPVPATIGGDVVRSVEFTFGAYAYTAPGATSGNFRIDFKGDDEQLFPDDDLTMIINDTASQAVHGIRSKTLPPNPLIADRVTLENYGRKFLERAARQARRASWVVPYDPLLLPGMRALHIDSMLKSIRTVYIEGVSHVMSSDPGTRQTSYQSVEYTL